MYQTGELHAGNMTRGAEDALEIPDGFGSFRIVLVKEAATIILVKDTGEAPRLMVKGLHILDLDQENVARLGILDLERARQIMNLG